MYSTRSHCIFCKEKLTNSLLPKDLEIPVGCYSTDEPTINLIPYNILLQHFVFCIIDIFEITYKKKYECIKFITELEYKHCSSFNKCIYYEYLLINIYNIIFIT